MTTIIPPEASEQPVAISRFPSYPKPRIDHPRGAGPIVVTLGNFDGVHRGHQLLLSEARSIAGPDGSVVLVSFYPHPSLVLKKGTSFLRITTLRQQSVYLRAFGGDLLYLVHFTSAIAQMSAADFLDAVIIDRLKGAALVVGPDARVGKDREGTPDLMKDHLRRRQCSVTVVPFMTAASGTRISSGEVRRLLAEGKIAEATELLGHPFAIEARISRGDARGRALGFRTVNLIPHEQVVPAIGVYASEAVVAGQRFFGVTNVGNRPTFGGGSLQVETHLLDYAGTEPLYGKLMSLEFIGRLRDEKKFSGPTELAEQIARDVAAAKQLHSARQGK